MSAKNNQAINDKLKNLISISPRDYCINSKSKSKHFLITDKFAFEELTQFISGQNSVLKFDEEFGLTKLYQLNKSATSFFKETGTWPLFIARYFLNATTSKNKKVYAPLILRRIKIEKNINNYSIYLIDDDYVINEKILTFIEREWDVNLSSLFDNDNNLQITDYIDKLQLVLNKKIEIINENENTTLFDDDSFYITDSFVIGAYEPGGGKLKDDLLKIIEQDIDPFDSQKIHGETYYKEQEINGDPIFQISNNLNLYQKYAIRSSLVENTVIHGPPGTGKSEVIANIIANIIINNNNALVISEKKAALDVVVERISKLKILSLSLYDDVKHEFYESIIKLANMIGTDWLSQSFNSTPFLLSDHIKLFDSYKRLNKFRHNVSLYANRIIGISKTNNELENKLYNFWSYLNDFGINKFLEWKNNEIVGQLNQNKHDTNYFNLLNQILTFVNKYNLDNENSYNTFKTFYSIVWNYFVENNTLKVEEFIEKIIQNIDQLIQLFNELYDKDEILISLKKNNRYIYDTYKTQKEIIKEYEKLINPDYFSVLNNDDFKTFLIQYNKTSDKNKKYFIHEYIFNKNIIEKFPLFKKSTNIDQYTVDFFDKLYENGFYFIDQKIIKNIKLFEPIYINCYFNQNFIGDILKDALNQHINLDMNFNQLNFIISNNINIEELQKFNDILSLQQELNINNLEINSSMLDTLLQENNDYSLDTQKILDIYLNNLKSILSKLSDELKNKVKELLRICHLKKRPTIFRILENYGDILKILFPIWFTKPESASLFLPLEQNLFNYGIFDEASQMFLEKSFPLVYRVNKAIVSGDEKQLKPSSFFMSMNNDEEIEYDMTDTNVAESLLEKAQASLWNTFILKNHYRSQSKELIEFSNKYIYNNELIFASINDNNQNKYGLETINVEGHFNNGVNKEESTKVIEILEQNIDAYKKIVIITFNASQSKYIEKEMLKKSNPKILQKLEQGLLVVTNLENVQGNEGDLVIISVSYAKKDSKSKLHSNFGPLINDGGSNRLNVAITRAKEKMIIVKSFNASDVSTTNNENLLIFRNFIAFLDSKENEQQRNINNEIKNDFANYLSNLATKNNFNIKYNLDIGSDTIDFLFYNDDQLIFSINYRSHNFYKNLIDINTDIDKNAFFNSRKYHTHLINEWEWIISKQNTIDYLNDLFIKYNTKK